MPERTANCQNIKPEHPAPVPLRERFPLRACTEKYASRNKNRFPETVTKGRCLFA